MRDVLFTSSATAKNGREGHVKSSDGILDLELVNPLQDKMGKDPILSNYLRQDIPHASMGH